MNEDEALKRIYEMLVWTSQRKLAQELGVHHNTVYRWLHGKQKITTLQQHAIENVYLKYFPRPCPGTSSADQQAEPSAGPPSPAAGLVSKRDRTT